jgi:hypothetical protein
MVLFSADLSENREDIIFFTPSNNVSRIYNVYESYLGPYPADPNNYWLQWKGWFDNPVANMVELYIGGHNLVRVDLLQDCCAQEWSIYDEPEAGTIYINVPQHTWLYDDVLTKYREVVSFLSGPKNSLNPSDDIFNNKHWPVRLETPKFTVKLSDVINGLTKYSTFDFILQNNDGYFDDIEETNFFNAPSYIRKSWKENPQVEDFIPIRYGMVESIKINDKTMTVSCADLFRTLEEPVSKVVKDLFPSAVDNTDEELPVIYGTVTIPLIKIDEYQYVAGENVTAVGTVYDKDGTPISRSFNNGIITTTQEAKYAIVTGNTNNKIGEVIVNIIANKTRIKYINSFWDKIETNNYITNSPRINIAFTGGSVRDAVKNSLISDMVFLIQKNDGKFTLRKWGNTYNIFQIKRWEITKFPSKDYGEAQKNYLSSCIVRYDYNFSEKDYNDSLLYNANEYAAEERYSKLVRKEFDTYLTNYTAAFNLGVMLSNRFSTLRETIQVSLGHDTSAINLLDTVVLQLNINGREFSKSNTWIVKEIDPAQDVLTLEPAYIQLPDEPDYPEPPEPPEPPPGENWWENLYIFFTFNDEQFMIPVSYENNTIEVIEELEEQGSQDMFYFHGEIINENTLNVILYKGYPGSANFIIMNEDYPLSFPLTLITADDYQNPYFGDVVLAYYNKD